MRIERRLREALRLSRIGRGYQPSALRPGQPWKSARRTRLPAGGVIVGPPGERTRAIELVRSEIAAGSYVTESRLAAALERLIASL
jgi:hypothetical protein